jgi:carboxymethylenebutenolidase
MKAGEAPQMAAKRDEYTKHAIDQGVFGAPFFVIDGEKFWGQDRLDFVDRKLAA